LAFVGSTRSSLPYPTHWARKLRIKNRKTEKIVKILDRIHSRQNLSPQKAHARIVAALQDSTYRREVWVATSGLLSKAKAQKALANGNRKRGALQFAYYLADLLTAFGRAGVTLRIFTAS
jgi:hypothetical protein